jgi:hypothetical protein
MAVVCYCLLQVSVHVEEHKYWYPAQTMAVDIRAEPGALVCLIGGHAGSEVKGTTGTQDSKSR